MTEACVDRFAWQRGLLRAGPLGRRIELRSTGGRHGAAAARVIDRPLRPIGRAASFFDQLVMRMKMGPRVSDPLAYMDTFLHTLPADVDGMAFMHSSTPGRCIAALSTEGFPRYVLKIGTSDDHRLQNEGSFLGNLSGMRFPFSVPELLFAEFVGDHFVLMSRAWENSRQVGLLSRDALLDITGALAAAGNGSRSVVHGDFAPWNLLRTPQGLGLVDWESARFADEPLRDMIHYLVQAGAHLRWFDVRQVVSELTHPQGSLAQLVSHLGCPQSLAEEALRAYFTTYPSVSVRRVRHFRDSVASGVGVSCT